MLQRAKKFLLISFSVLLCQGVQCWHMESLVDSFVKLSKFVRSRDLLFFTSLEIDAKDLAKVEEFMIILQRQLVLPQMVISNRSDMRIGMTEAKINYFAVVFTTGARDPIMEIHNGFLLDRHSALNLVVMVPIVDEFSIIEEILRDLRYRNFPYISLHTQSTNGSYALWAYKLFPHFVIENRTDIFASVKSQIKHIVGATLHVGGYELKTPLRQDLPYVFPYVNKAGLKIRYGTSYSMMELYTRFINASLVDYKMPPDRLGGEVMNMKEALSLVRERKVPLLAHAYALYTKDEEVDKSFPLMVVKWCLMVPVWNSVSTYFYAVQPFDNVVWFAFILTLFAFLFADLACGVWWKFHKSPKDINSKETLLKAVRATILDDFCLVLNLSTSHSLGVPTTAIRAFLLLSVFFFGFFLSVNYTSLLGSILTVNLFRENINTMEDLIRTNMSVMIIDYELDFLVSGGNDLNAEFMKLLRPADVTTFNKHQLALNTSYAYFITEDKWHFINLQQKSLEKYIFKFTDICFGSYHLAYPLEPNSLLWRSLEYYIFRMHSSGILEHYESASFEFAVHAGLMTRIWEDKKFTSAGMQHICMVFMYLLLFSLLGFLVFLGEHIHFWYYSRKLKYEN